MKTSIKSKERSISSSWETPQKLFDELSEKYGPFTYDLCATEENKKCEYYYKDYLNNITGRDRELSLIRYQTLNGATCFMNPPYSNPLPFIQKAWKDSKYCKIVLLVRVDPSTKWWAIFWDYNIECPYCAEANWIGLQKCFSCKGTKRYSGPKPGCSYEFLPKRVQFDPPPEINAWKEGNSWCVECNGCEGMKLILNWPDPQLYRCPECKGTGARKLAGPSLASAVLIFDRRSVL